MKKYHLADVCTALECVCAIIIIGMATQGTQPEYALVVFFIGQIFDAIDGPLARHFRYPNDGKIRWWRVHASLIDQLSDLFIGIAIGIYLTVCINTTFGLTALISATVIGGFIQNLAYDFPPLRLNWLETKPKLGRIIVLARRWVYVMAICIVIAILLWSTTWPFSAKLTITIIFVGVGLVLAICKLNRLTEVKTL